MYEIMKISGALVASVAAASATAISSSSSSAAASSSFPSYMGAPAFKEEDGTMWKNESGSGDYHFSRKSTASSNSLQEKFAPRFDGLRFIETLVTAHR